MFLPIYSLHLNCTFLDTKLLIPSPQSPSSLRSCTLDQKARFRTFTGGAGGAWKKRRRVRAGWKTPRGCKMKSLAHARCSHVACHVAFRALVSLPSDWLIGSHQLDLPPSITHDPRSSYALRLQGSDAFVPASSVASKWPCQARVIWEEAEVGAWHQCALVLGGLVALSVKRHLFGGGAYLL